MKKKTKLLDISQQVFLPKEGSIFDTNNWQCLDVDKENNCRLWRHHGGIERGVEEWRTEGRRNDRMREIAVN